jgi:hypothetical protein
VATVRPRRALAAPVADLVNARSRHAGSLGELYSGDAELQSLADEAAQLDVGGVECVSAGCCHFDRTFAAESARAGRHSAQRIYGSYTFVELSKGAATERWRAAGRGQLNRYRQTAIPADVERATSASVQATAKATNSHT